MMGDALLILRQKHGHHYWPRMPASYVLAPTMALTGLPCCVVSRPNYLCLANLTWQQY